MILPDLSPRTHNEKLNNKKSERRMELKKNGNVFCLETQDESSDEELFRGWSMKYEL